MKCWNFTWDNSFLLANSNELSMMRSRDRLFYGSRNYWQKSSIIPCQWLQIFVPKSVIILLVCAKIYIYIISSISLDDWTAYSSVNQIISLMKSQGITCNNQEEGGIWGDSSLFFKNVPISCLNLGSLSRITFSYFFRVIP